MAEAMVAVVLIAVGLVFVTRGFGASLKALGSIQRYDQLLYIAESTLEALSVEAQHAPPLPPARRQGDCRDAGGECEWHLELASFAPDVLELPPDALRSVTLVVRQAATTLRLHTVWPSDWVAEQPP